MKITAGSEPGGSQQIMVPDPRVVDPHLFNANLDPAFFLIGDPAPVSNPGF
jgi:hypothetical protein